MLISLSTLTGCSSELEVRVVTPLQIPAEADRLVVTATGSDGLMYTRDLALSRSPLHFQVDFQSSRPEQLPMRLELWLADQRAGHAQVELTGVPRASCYVVEIPPVQSKALARAYTCQEGDGPGSDHAAGGAPDAGLDGGSSTEGFPTDYAPSNVDLTGLTFSTAMTVDGRCDFNTTTGTFAGSCGREQPDVTYQSQRTPNTRALAVVALQSMHIEDMGLMTIHGDAAAVFVVRDDIVVDGEINASAQTGVASAIDPTCESQKRSGASATDSSTDRGGGGGGGLGSPGGAGSRGAAGGSSILPPALVSGCPGGAGYDPADPCQTDPTIPCLTQGGHGGGALQLSCGGTFRLSGSVISNGMGGQGGIRIADFLVGGGGGGSGGMIVIEASRVDFQNTATVLAVGGGGGGGGGLSGSGQDGAGDPGYLQGTLVPAPGGSGGPGSSATAESGGSGGPGSVSGASGSAGLPSLDTGQPRGGGGGGGGAGLVFVKGNRECIKGGLIASRVFVADACYP